MTTREAAKSTSPAPIRTPPASTSGVVAVGTPVAMRIVPAFQVASCAPIIRRDGGSVARNAHVKNCAVPSTSWEIPPTKTRCSATQCCHQTPVTSDSTPKTAAASMNAMPGAKKAASMPLGRGERGSIGRQRGQRLMA